MQENYQEQDSHIDRRNFMGLAGKVLGLGALGVAATGCAVGQDLDKYRLYSVDQGSRGSLTSLEKGLEDAGMALESGYNFFTIGYGTDMAQPFRENDGKDIGWQTNEFLKQGGRMLGTIGEGLYSILDLVALDSLKDAESAIYQETGAIERPFIYGGRAVGEVFKTAEKLGNVATLGHFDNLTGTAGQAIYHTLESIKHGVQAATNSVRGPVYLLTGPNEGLEQVGDWALLVPFEYISNVMQAEGFTNTLQYQRALVEKGMTGTFLEIGGTYFGVIKAIENNRRSDSKKRSNGGTDGPTPPEPPVFGDSPPGKPVFGGGTPPVSPF